MQKENFIQLSNLRDKKICILCRKQGNGKTVRVAISRSAHIGSYDFHICDRCGRRKSPGRKKVASAILLVGAVLSVILTVMGYDHAQPLEIKFAPISMAALIAVCILAEQGSLSARRNNLVLDYLAGNVEAEGIHLDVINNKGLRDSRFSRYMPYKWEKIKKENDEKR